MTTLTNEFAPEAAPRPTRSRQKAQGTDKAGFNAYHAIAEMAGTLRNYQNIPLNFGRHWITGFLAIMVLAGMLIGLYLNVTARAAIAGREIQNLEAEITANKRVNADLQTQIAGLLSYHSLDERAKAMGFEPLKQEEMDYIVVPGYFPQQGVSLVTPTADADILATSPEYSESLFSWLARQMEIASVPLSQVR
ncbi:MAG: hypothetical protein NT121_07600 [Chloroflexi bacterium]|jgi:hypothetical protein|nr:hypothetical protein [Chloroflexota bacterium]